MLGKNSLAINYQGLYPSVKSKEVSSLCGIIGAQSAYCAIASNLVSAYKLFSQMKK